MIASWLRRSLPIVLALAASFAAASPRQSQGPPAAAGTGVPDPETLALLSQAVAASQRGQNDAAVALYRQVHERQPQFTPATLALADALRETGRTTEALTLYREAAALEPLPLTQAALAVGLVTPGGDRVVSYDDKKQASSICHALISEAGVDSGTLGRCAILGLLTSEADLMAAAVTKLERIAPEQVPTWYLSACSC